MLTFTRVMFSIERFFSQIGNSTTFANRRNKLRERALPLAPSISRFSPWGLRFSQRGLRFSPWGLRFSPRGLRFSPWGLRFSQRGLRFSLCGLHFSPWGLKS